MADHQPGEPAATGGCADLHMHTILNLWAGASQADNHANPLALGPW